MTDQSAPPFTNLDPVDPAVDRGRDSTKTAAHNRWMGGLLCATSAAGFASLSILGKLGFQAGFTLSGMLGLRFGGAALILLLGLLLFRRQAVFPGFRVTLILFGIGAVLYALQSTLYFTGLQRIPASLCSLLLYLYPVFVVFLNWRLNQTPPTRVEWGAMILALSGVALTLEPNEILRVKTTLEIDPLGVLSVIASALGYGAYIVISARYATSAGVVTGIAWISAGAAVSFSLGGLLVDGW